MVYLLYPIPIVYLPIHNSNCENVYSRFVLKNNLHIPINNTGKRRVIGHSTTVDYLDKNKTI